MEAIRTNEESQLGVERRSGCGGSERCYNGKPYCIYGTQSGAKKLRKNVVTYTAYERSPGGGLDQRAFCSKACLENFGRPAEERFNRSHLKAEIRERTVKKEKGQKSEQKDHFSNLGLQDAVGSDMVG